MPRYIDADALISKLAYHRDGLDHSNVTAVSVLNNVIEIIERRPTVSPDEMRGVGKWKLGYFGSISDATEKWYDKLLQGGFLYCSACKCRSNAKTNYCPNCGARMEVSEDA